MSQASGPCDAASSPCSELLFFAGFDVHSDNFVAAHRLSGLPPVQPGDIRKMKSKQFPRTRQGATDFLVWIDSKTPEGARLLIVMESTSSYSLQLACWLRELRPGLCPVIVEPKRIIKYAGSIGTRNKTDRIDARVIACFGAERQPVGDEPVEVIYRDLRALHQARTQFMDAMQALRNQRDSLCHENLSKSISREITRGFDSQIKALEKQMNVLEEQMRKVVDSDEKVGQDVKLLCSMVGVKFLTAVGVLGIFGDLRRFPTSRSLTAFAGLNPEIKESGKRQGESHISKRGNANARRVLYMAATSVIKSNSELAEFYNRLVNDAHKEKMVALVALMRKMLLTMRSLLVSGQTYDRYYHARRAKAAQEQSAAKAQPGACAKLCGDPVESGGELPTKKVAA